MWPSRSAAVRTPDEIAVMHQAGQVVAEMHEKIRAAIEPGVSTAALDRIGREVLHLRGATSNFLHYHGYPAVICASPNSMVVHGIPSDEVILADGDIISIDCGAIIDGWHGDAAFTAPVGDVSSEALRLIEVAGASLDAAIAVMVAGNRLGDIGHAVSSVAMAAGFGVVEGYSGHAIGRQMHESPNVHNIGEPGTGMRLRVGNVLAVEPMIVMGDIETDVLDDGWSVIASDGSWSAHVEHTIAITADGPVVLTAGDQP